MIRLLARGVRKGRAYVGEGIGKGLGGGCFQHGEVEEGKRALEGGFGLRGWFAEAGKAVRCEGSDALEVLEPGLREVGEVPWLGGG